MRRKLIFATILLAVCAIVAAADPIDYSISFIGTGGVGPGQFIFDSKGAKGVVLDPPVSFSSFVVLVGGAPFTPMSAVDDGLIIDSAGFVSALNVDANPASGTPFVQLSENRTYAYFDSSGATIGAGTYSIVATPEPTYVGLLGLGLGGLFLRFLRRT